MTLLRWNQVATGAELPRLWQQIAKAPKGQHRQVVQRAVDETIEMLQYSSMRLLISAVTAKKVVSLDWKVYDDDDLSSVLRPFSVGYVSVEEANQQSRADYISDMMYSGDAARREHRRELLYINLELLKRHQKVSFSAYCQN
jgi:hypothetical protein